MEKKQITAEEYLIKALGGNMNISTLKLRFWTEIMADYAKYASQFTTQRQEITDEEIHKWADSEDFGYGTTYIIAKIAAIKGAKAMRDKQGKGIDLREELHKIQSIAESQLAKWGDDMSEHSIEARGMLMVCNRINEYLSKIKPQ